MKVLYDSAGMTSPFGGVPLSFAEMIRRLPESVEPVLAIRRTCNESFQSPPYGLPACPDLYRSFVSTAEFRGKWRLWQMAKRFFPRWFPDYEAENEGYLSELLDRGDFDVLHLTGAHVYGNAWRKVVGKKPIVITVHDLIPEIIRHDVRIGAIRREMLNAASHVIAVSECTKRDLICLYGVDEEKVTVVHHGSPRVGDGQSTTAGCRLPTAGYLLFVGGRAGYKNWGPMVTALAPLLKEGLRLVCTGLPFSNGERRLLRRLGVSDRVEQRRVRMAEFPSLYARAAAFVFPSRYEGFGLPILDAFAAGCPVVLARRSCFPEIAADAAEYFDPEDGDALRNAVVKILDDAGWRAELARRGKLRTAAFSWKRAALETASVYERCCR